ncbi:hypothetical protein CMEL01_02585, partial [Colletotrichum melonis]
TIPSSPSHRHHHHRHLFHRFISNSQTQLKRNEINVVHHSSSKRGTQNQPTDSGGLPSPPLARHRWRASGASTKRHATPVPQIRLTTSQNSSLPTALHITQNKVDKARRRCVGSNRTV